MAPIATQQRAYRLWQQRNCPTGDDKRDLFRAELIEQQYPYYLSYQAEHHLQETVSTIEAALVAVSKKDSTNGIILLAVLDGSTESMEAAYERVFLSSPFNGATPTPGLMAGKERTFRQFCHRYFGDASAIFSQQQLPPTLFPFRDACIATFTGDQHDGLISALANSVELLNGLADFNLTHNLTWESQIHARISIADRVPLVISNICYSRRDKLILTPSLSSELGRSELLLLRSAGLRTGSPTSDGPAAKDRSLLISKLVGPTATLPTRNLQSSCR